MRVAYTKHKRLLSLGRGGLIMLGMAKKKSRKGGGGSGHLGAMVRVPPDLHALLKELAEQNSRPLSWELRLAITTHLRAAGKWPPPAENP